MSTLQKGDFVRVKDDSVCRAGQDGMVVAPVVDGQVGLFFGFDRYGRGPEKTGVVVTGATEAWMLDELDLATLES